MKKNFLLPAFVLVSTLSLGNFTVFAADLQPTYVEIPISQAMAEDIQQKVEAQVVHQDGSVTIIEPEYKLYKVDNMSLSQDESEAYMLEVNARYSKDSTSGFDDAKADAEVTSTMWFIDNIVAGDQLTRARVEFSAASDVQVFNRTLEYGGLGTSGTSPRDKKIGMYFDENFSGVQGGPGLGVYTEVTADVESFGVTDSLRVYLKS